MNHNEINEIATVIAAKLKELEVRPNQRGWQLIVDEVKRLMTPRVRLVFADGSSPQEFAVGSESLDRAMAIYVQTRVKFTCEPVD